MAVTDQQKIDFLLKKIGFTKTKTGSVVGTGAISGTPKQPFAEAIPSPLIIANGALWNESDSIPATPPGSDTAQVKVYLAASSGLRMTADATSSGQRAYIAYSTYGNASSTRLTNWIDTQFGASYLIKVYKGDPNSGGVALSAAGSGANDGWFFDYSAGVLNFNDTNVPSGVTDTNIYIVGYRYIGLTGAPTATGGGNFVFDDLIVNRNLKVGGISTFTGLVDINGGGQANTFKVEDLTDNRVVIAGTGGELEDSANLTFDGSTLAVTGDATFSGNVAIGGTLTYEDVKNIDAVGLITARSGIRVTGGVIEAQAGENKIPSLYSNMGALPNPGTYHGMFAHVHSTGRGYFSHAGGWYELVNKESNGVVGTGTESYNIGSLNLKDLDVDQHTNLDNVSIAGVTTIAQDLDVDGHTNLDNVNIAGVTTFAGIIEGISGQNKIPSLYGAMPDLPSAATYHGMFAHVHATGRGYFSHAGGWYELVNKETNGNVGTGTETYNIGNITATALDLNGDIDVDGHTNLDNVSISGVTTAAGLVDMDGGGVANTFKVEDLTSGRVVFAGSGGELEDSNNLRFDGSNLFVSGINVITAGSASTSIIGVDIVTRNLKATGLSTFVGNAQFDSGIKAGGGFGNNGQYLKTTGSGVAWESFPSLRTRQTFTASAGQTTFSFAYTIGFLDVFVNGIKLTDSEFTATNGSTTVLAVGCFVGDIVELVAYNTVSAGGGAFGIGNVVEDLTPQLGGNLDLFNKDITGTGNININGNVTATNFIGNGSGLTGVIASGTGIIIKDSGSTVGTAGTIDFGANLSVSPASAGIVTITAQAGGGSTAEVRANTLVVTGVSTLASASFTGDLDVDGHTNLDNVSIAGVTTFATAVNGTTFNATTFAGNGEFIELDVDGHTNLDNVNVAGVATFASAIYAYDIRSNAITLKNAAGGATYATFSNGGAATLNFDNTPRLATTNAGITVTGTISATSFSGDGSQLTGITGISTAEVRANTLNVIGVSTLTNLDVDDYIDVGNNIQLGNAGVATASQFVGNLFVGNGGTADINGDLDVDGHTNLDNVNIAGFVTATKYFGDGSGLTGVVASGTGVVIKDDGNTVGTAGTFDFTSPIDVTPISAGITTVGISTVGFNVENLDVAGISTFGDDITLASKIKHHGDTTTSFGFPENLAISFNTNGSERLRIGPLGQIGIAGAQYGSAGQVLTSGGSGSIVQWTTVTAAVGISTNIANGYTQNSGATQVLDTYAYGTDDLVFEYTIFVKIGSDFQSQKLLAMRDGTTIHSTQFAVMFSSSLLVQAEAINSGGNIVLRITPETGVSGAGNYRVKREVM